MEGILITAAMVPKLLKLGMQNMQSGKLSQAKQVYEQVLQVNPNQTEAMQWLGVVFHQLGDSGRAIELLTRGISLDPNNAFLHSTYGNLLQAIGQSAAAIKNYKIALELNPQAADIHNNLGVALFSNGQHLDAIESYKTAVRLVPNYAHAYNNLGVVLHAVKRWDEAINAFKQAISFAPSYAEAYKNLGGVLQAKGLPEAALIAYNNALQIAPRYAPAIFGAAHIYKDSQPELAISLYRRGLNENPNYYDAQFHLGDLLQYQGDIEEAAKHFQRVLQISPTNGVYILVALLLPMIMGTREEVKASRLKFEANLEVLIEEKIPLLDPVKEFGRTNFLLAYHGLNDKKVLQRVAEFYEQACPALLYEAPHCARTKEVGAKRRIGFLSKYITKHSVALSFQAIIQALVSRNEFEIYLISHTDADDALVHSTYPALGERFVRITNDLTIAREQISKLELDVLVYLDIGMEAFGYFLAYSRLARIQCVAGGHPVTTGVRNLDYFLSSDLIESADADDHYSEELVRLPFGLLYLPRPGVPQSLKTRSELGLPNHGNLYLCPLLLHKLHPDFDDAIEKILQQDLNGYIVLIADKEFTYRQEKINERFKKTLSRQVLQRVIFIPWVSDAHDFMALINSCEVVLDSFHFGLGTTIIPVAAVGTPFVTKPSEYQRGRVGLYYAKLLGLEECVAHTTEDYAKLAVSVACDPKLRLRLKNTFLRNRHVLFQNPRAIEDIVAFLSTVVERQR